MINMNSDPMQGKDFMVPIQSAYTVSIYNINKELKILVSYKERQKCTEIQNKSLFLSHSMIVDMELGLETSQLSN